MFGALLDPDWLDRLYEKAEAELSATAKPPAIPLWLPEIEDALKEGRILNPFDEAVKMARGE